VKCADCKVIGTEALLRSAIENVLRNAARHTAEGTEAEVELSVLGAGRASSAVIRVRDHGPGVPEPALNEIFRPFYRLGDDRGRQTGGTGLGLAITERAVRLHGGTVTAFNADDGGLVVELSLPISASVGQAASPSMPKNGDGSSGNGGLNQLRNEFLMTARRVATATKRPISDVVEEATRGALKYGDIGGLSEADVPKLRAAIESLASAAGSATQ
jgi:hypothetical protein